LADELDDAAALIDFLAKHFAQIAAFQPEDLLPDRLVAKESEGVGDKLPRARSSRLTAEMKIAGLGDNAIRSPIHSTA
jgi:hypothetical protein